MNIATNQEIHTHLIRQNEFLNALKDNFDENQAQEIIEYSKDISKKYPETMDQFYDWFNDQEGKKNILFIGWDSKNWGVGGNGFISFDLVFDLVKITSSSFEGEHIEIFNKETFYPWAIEDLKNDFIELSSEIYSELQLIEIAVNLGMNYNTVLTVNDRIISWKK